MLTEAVYDDVYAGRHPTPIALKDVKNYVNQLQDKIKKFNKEYRVTSNIRFLAKLQSLFQEIIRVSNEISTLMLLVNVVNHR